MSNRRPAMPKAVREQVLDEFNHRCAVCGEPKPQLHHIDNDNANNDPQNLIPLCPNHHLIDQHNPTRTIHPDKLKLFRTHKDPVILWPQFDPLFQRLRFLEDPDHDLSYLQSSVNRLVAFIENLEMGNFYGGEVRSLLPPVGKPSGFSGNMTSDALHRYGERVTRETRQLEEAFRQRLHGRKDMVHALVVEMLRYQKWQKPDSDRLRG